MALFQPTNIIPSSFTQGTVDAVKNNIEISWQVNGNSAMTAFQIDFYLNDANSTPVGNGTGKITDNIPTGGFYGTDRFGRPQMFTWNGGNSEHWNDLGFVNGNDYKYKITQWYKGIDSVISIETKSALSKGTTYYFNESATSDSSIIIFSVSQNISTTNNTVYYSYTTGNIWVDSGTKMVMCSGYITSGSTPSGAIKVSGTPIASTLDELFISQTDGNVFITRDTPTVTIYLSNAQYTDKNPFPSGTAIDTSIGYFVAEYEQLQNAPIREVNWEVAQVNNNEIGEILFDTGNIDTPTLQYEFNGFFNGQSYAIRCFGKADYQTYGSQDFTSGWIYFAVNIENQGDYSGEFTVQCLNKENAMLLKWEALDVILPTITPQDYNPELSDGTVTILPKSGNTEYSITWDKKEIVEDGENKTIPMNFTAPWTIGWKGKTSFDLSYVSDILGRGQINSSIAVFSPDGKTLVLGGDSVFDSYICAVNGTTIIRVDLIQINGSYPNGLTAAAFSPDGKTLVLSGGFRGSVAIFSINGTDITYVADITKNGESLWNVSAAAFSPDGKTLVLCESYDLKTSAVFSVNGTTVTYVADITVNGESLGNVSAAAFSPDGKMLVLGSAYQQYSALIFSVNGTDIIYVANTTIDGERLRESSAVAFSPDGKTLVLSGGIYKNAAIFSVEGITVKYIANITKNGMPLSPRSDIVVYSPDGKTLILGGDFNGYASIFSVDGTKVTYVADVTKSGAPLESSVGTVAFSPDGKTLVIGGEYGSFIFELSYTPQGKLLTVGGNDLTLTVDQNIFSLHSENTELASVAYPPATTSVAIIITSNAMYGFFYTDGRNESKENVSYSFTQHPITSVSIYGGDSGVTIDTVSVYNGELSAELVNQLYENVTFEPVWNNPDYSLYMTANFNNNLEGGTGTTTGNGFRIYRQEVGKNILTPIATMPSTVTSIKDYGIRSRKSYKYSIYAYDNNGAFMNSVENDKVISTCFKSYSVLVCDYDDTNDEYHVRKQYIFALNLSDGSVGNNNSPTLNANFTRYPTRMPSTQNYASGTLSGLIGAIYTVPALIEQIGNYKWTAKPSTLDYFDNVDLEQELYDLSTAPYQLFLRDMKGRLRMIHTSSPITMTTNIKQKQQSISMSLPWVEIGDASDVTIIQTPDDLGWNNDTQVLDVMLDVDVGTGDLYAHYPFPYEGTKFYLTGVNKETLTAKTPLGITPAQFDLSKTAIKPTDGEVMATIKTNVSDK